MRLFKKHKRKPQTKRKRIPLFDRVERPGTRVECLIYRQRSVGGRPYHPFMLKPVGNRVFLPEQIPSLLLSLEALAEWYVLDETVPERVRSELLQTLNLFELLRIRGNEEYDNVTRLNGTKS